MKLVEKGPASRRRSAARGAHDADAALAAELAGADGLKRAEGKAARSPSGSARGGEDRSGGALESLIDVVNALGSIFDDLEAEESARASAAAVEAEAAASAKAEEAAKRALMPTEAPLRSGACGRGECRRAVRVHVLGRRLCVLTRAAAHPLPARAPTAASLEAPASHPRPRRPTGAVPESLSAPASPCSGGGWAAVMGASVAHMASELVRTTTHGIDGAVSFLGEIADELVSDPVPAAAAAVVGPALALPQVQQRRIDHVAAADAVPCEPDDVDADDEGERAGDHDEVARARSVRPCPSEARVPRRPTPPTSRRSLDAAMRACGHAGAGSDHPADGGAASVDDLPDRDSDARGNEEEEDGWGGASLVIALEQLAGFSAARLVSGDAEGEDDGEARGEDTHACAGAAPASARECGDEADTAGSSQAAGGSGSTPRNAFIMETIFQPYGPPRPFGVGGGEIECGSDGDRSDAASSDLESVDLLTARRDAGFGADTTETDTESADTSAGATKRHSREPSIVSLSSEGSAWELISSHASSLDFEMI